MTTPAGQAGLSAIQSTYVDLDRWKARAIKARARQNVVLELGMLLARLGRKRVGIVMPTGGEVLMERPSDIAGLVYLAYHDSIEDVRMPLAKELSAAGLTIEVSKM